MTLAAACLKFVCISFKTTRNRLPGIQSRFGISPVSRAYINILIICCFVGSSCICLMNESSSHTPFLEVYLMWLCYWGRISLVNVLGKLLHFLLSGQFYIRLDFTISEGWILVSLSLGQFFRQSQTFPPLMSLHLESVTSWISSINKLFLRTPASEGCPDHLLTVKMLLSLVLCPNIIMAIVGCDPQKDKGLVLSPWCYLGYGTTFKR